MNSPNLYRRRFIPNELIHLKDDIILSQEDDLIITKWFTLHPRSDIARGISAIYMEKGFKISKIYNRDNHLVYWYCDIIQVKKNTQKNTVVIEDLLIDVILYNDGTYRVVDLDELADALEQKLISVDETVYALRTLDHLLRIISDGQFQSLQEPINLIESR